MFALVKNFLSAIVGSKTRVTFSNQPEKQAVDVV